MRLEELRTMKCVPCEGGVPTLTPEEIAAFLREVHGWTTDGTHIRKSLVFANFLAAMAFLGEVATIAEAEAHHPDFTLHSWNKVDLVIWTHAIGGLSRNDFILAAKIDTLPSSP